MLTTAQRRRSMLPKSLADVGGSYMTPRDMAPSGDTSDTSMDGDTCQ
jgi:hypothetical protein